MASELSSHGGSLSVRRAGADDVPALVALMEEFYAESGFSLDGEWARASFSRLIGEPALGCVWIAHEGDTPAGHAVLTLRYAMEHGALSAHVDDLFVRPELRRRGVARRLLEELVAEARRRGCRSMYVEVGSDNVAAMRLYASFGLQPFRDGRVVLAAELESR